VLLELGPQFLISDRSMDGQPGRAYNRSGWGIPRWGMGRTRDLSGPQKPMGIGARYFCGDCNSTKENKPVAQGHKFGPSKAEYQEAVTAHYADNHKDLHYPIDQNMIDAHAKAKAKAHAKLRLLAQLQDVGVKLTQKEKDALAPPMEGGLDLSTEFAPMGRPREIFDLTEFDFPDANVADAATEEIEFDQLISIAARMGRRFFGMEVQNLDIEVATEFLTSPDNADLDITFALEVNTRTGQHNLDDPENLWRYRNADIVANVEATAGTGTAIYGNWSHLNNPLLGGQVYVSPRLFVRFSNEMDRQIDTGDLFARMATLQQRLGTFLLFELLEQYSGLFGFAA